MKNDKHNHDSFEHACPKCGLAPRQIQPPVPWGFEFLTQNLAPCTCGGAAMVAQDGTQGAIRYYCYCQNHCGAETRDFPTKPEAIYDWNQQQISKGFDVRKLHPLNKKD